MTNYIRELYDKFRLKLAIRELIKEGKVYKDKDGRLWLNSKPPAPIESVQISQR